MNNVVINIKDPKIVRQVGVEALAKSLGPVGMANFFRQFDTGSGDYTKERETILPEFSIDEICKEINDRKTV